MPIDQALCEHRPGQPDASCHLGRRDGRDEAGDEAGIDVRSKLRLAISSRAVQARENARANLPLSWSSRTSATSSVALLRAP